MIVSEKFLDQMKDGFYAAFSLKWELEYCQRNEAHIRSNPTQCPT